MSLTSDQGASAVPSAGAIRPLSLPWRLLEGWFQRRYGMRTLTDERDCLLAYNLFRHTGPAFKLKCGTVVQAGDLLMELHFRREALIPLMLDGDSSRMGLGLLALGDRDVPKVGLLLEADPEFAEVKAAHALTMFHRGITRYGFEVVPMRPGLECWWFTQWHRMLMIRDHAHGLAHVRENADKLVTKHIWVSRQELIRRYGVNGTRRRAKLGAAG